MKRLVVVMLAGCGLIEPSTPSSPLTGPIVLNVDATDAPRAIYHVHITMPVRSGALSLVSPKWIPGEHRMTGPVWNLVNVHFSAAGKPLEWRRDGENMYEMRLVVPDGAERLDVDLDALGGDGESSTSTTSQLLVLEWNTVILHPKGIAAESVAIVPTIKLPNGWAHATALPLDAMTDGAARFRTVSVETLVDSPLIAGAHLKTYDLGDVRGAKHSLAIASDSEEGATIPAATTAKHRKLIAEADALFGAHHYHDYQFLVTASERTGYAGLEHHASSDNRVPEHGESDEDQRRGNADLLSHEYTHSWNGKYRRPRGLLSPTFQEPMRGELLWVYEGLTQYIGWVLAARSGLYTPEDARTALAASAANVDEPGRTWRPLVDTAVAAQALYGNQAIGTSSRRSVDFYDEGLLIWLEADVAIRKKTNGARSLDDFCKKFFGGADSAPMMKPYELEDVLRVLDSVAPNDWKGFFAARVYRVAPLPTGGIDGAGYRYTTTDKKPALFEIWEKAFKGKSYARSLGFSTNEDNIVRDVMAGSAAGRGGLAAGMKLVAVNTRKLSSEAMTDALANARTSKEPILLLVENGGFFQTLSIDYHDGDRYPAVERVDSRPDLLQAILAPRTK